MGRAVLDKETDHGAVPCCSLDLVDEGLPVIAHLLWIAAGLVPFGKVGVRQLGRVLVEVLEGRKVIILLLLLGIIAGGIHGCSVGRCALAKASELRAKSKAASRLPSLYFLLHCEAWLWRKYAFRSTARPGV